MKSHPSSQNDEIIDVFSIFDLNVIYSKPTSFLIAKAFAWLQPGRVVRLIFHGTISVVSDTASLVSKR